MPTLRFPLEIIFAEHQLKGIAQKFQPISCVDPCVDATQRLKLKSQKENTQTRFFFLRGACGEIRVNYIIRVIFDEALIVNVGNCP